MLRLALTAMGLLLSACQGWMPGAPRAADTRLDRILASGELRVALSADRPPLNLRSESGEIVGFEVDIVRALADAMGLELRTVVTPFADLLGSLERGEADLALSGLTITPERNARVAFAGPYFISGTSLLTRSRELAETRDPKLLDAAGRRYAAVASSTSESFVRAALPASELVAVSDYGEGVRRLLAGEVDALVADHLVCSFLSWERPDAGLFVLATPLSIEPLGIAVPPGAPLLLNLVENHLDTLEATGRLAQLKALWLADGSWRERIR